MVQPPSGPQYHLAMEAYCQHASWLPVADVDGGAVLLDEQHRVEACIGLAMQASEHSPAAVGQPGRCVQVAGPGGSGLHSTLLEQATDMQGLVSG